jgi:hypothetical protein
MPKRLFLVLWVVCMSQSLLGKEIVVGIEPVPIKKTAFLFTPVVFPDLLSAKAAFEYRLHRKFNLVIPLEAKWMDYAWAIKTGAKIFNVSQDLPRVLYLPDRALRPGWNIDILQFKISTGVGAKWFPFSESMTNAFFIKTAVLAGFEHFNAYHAEGKQDSAVFTHVLTIGYNWVKRGRFTFGFEIGEEYVWHTNGIKHMPILVDGLVPLMQFSLGFTI